MAERCSRIINRIELQLILDIPANTRSCESRHVEALDHSDIRVIFHDDVTSFGGHTI